MTGTGTSQIAEIPDGWRMARLGDVADVIMGQSPPGELVVDWNGSSLEVDGLPFIQGNAEFGTKYPSPLKWCTKRFKVGVPGDTLISVRAPVGETNRTNIEVGIGRGLAAVRFSKKSQSFGWHILNHSKNALARVAQGSTFLAVNISDLRKLPILLPPLPEQRAIAKILDSIDDAIESSEAAIADTEQLRDSLLHELLTRGVPGWHTDWKQERGIGEMPADWRVARLGDVAEVIMGQSPPGELVIDWEDSGAEMEGLPFIQGNAEFGDKYPSPLKWCTKRFKVGVSGDILISVRAPVGETNRTNIDIGIGRGLAAVRFSKNSQEFGWHMLNYRKGALSRVAQGSTFLAVNSGDLRKLPIPIPPLPEQQAIAAMLDSVDAAVERSREDRDMLQSLKASTADALLTGRARLPVSY